MSSLTKVFNAFLLLCKLPLEWKMVNVVPVYKKGLSNNIENYRPVSLLCIAEKILEKCIYQHIFPITRQLINIEQHGFMDKKSTVSNLLLFYDNVLQSIDKGKQFDVAYLDLSKAFDTVPHDLLLYKLTTLVLMDIYLNGLKIIFQIEPNVLWLMDVFLNQ